MATPRPTSVSFLWHMHQPWYGEPQSGRMAMPWVRLHALKDYLDMIAAAEAHPAAHLGFNLVPSLLLQLQLYVDGQTTDRAAECGRRPAADLSQEEQLWLLDNGFKCHWPRWVDPVPRFRELLEKRGRTPSSLERARQRYTPQDYRDLQVWSHLAWCGYELRTHHPLVRELLAKGTGYSEDEKSALLDALDAVLPTILPRYLAAARQGHVELTTTPFYHPILPLLCHYPDARAAMPGCRLPRNATDLPADAAEQLRRGRQLWEAMLGEAPQGLWPSEGSVSTAALELAAAEGFRWAATDDQILANSLLHQADPLRREPQRPQPTDFLQPHRHAGLAIFFRHHTASDKIGFDYAGWDPAAAVGDFIRLLERTAQHGQQLERPVISIILDGENCWEYYPNNGRDFLDRLYAALVQHPWLEPLTFSEHLAQAPEPPALDYLFPGSWINHDFYIWAGHREDQRAWELLFAARAALVAGEAALDPETRRQAWEHLYIAEGSDWFWWYGDDHSSAEDSLFDQLFRGHLERIYQLLGEAVPAALAEPIAGLAPPAPLTPPVAPFTPVLDGRETDFFEWRAAGRIEGRRAAGAMSRSGLAAGSHLGRIRYGFDTERLYLAVEPSLPAEGRWELRLEWSAGGRSVGLMIGLTAGPQHEDYALEGAAGQVAEVVADKLVEIGLPRAALPAGAGEAAELVVSLACNGELAERWPEQGCFELPMPDEDDWLSQWLV